MSFSQLIRFIPPFSGGPEGRALNGDHRAFARPSGPPLNGIAIAALAALACGPSFPNQVIVEGDGRIARLPTGHFGPELQRLLPPGKPEPYAATSAVMAVDEDVAELVEAMTVAGTPKPDRDRIAAAYKPVRAALCEYAEKHKRWPLSTTDSTDHYDGPVELPDGLPDEFALYTKGLILFHQGHLKLARDFWTEVVQKPAPDRSYRGAAAAYQLAWSYFKDEPAKAVDWFAKTRALAEHTPDPSGLAAASLGWEARIALDDRNYAKAIHLYLRHRATGAWEAVESLRMTAARAFADATEQQLADYAKDDDVRRVLTTAAICEAYPYGETARRKQWLAAVESAGVTDVAGAERLAWAGYQTGDFDGAARWVTRSSPDSVVARWVKAKLQLRDGKLDAAADTMAGIVKSFPPTTDMTEPWGDLNLPREITSDLGVLQLTRGQYGDSLRLLLRADRWLDAAYVAERVLTVDELKGFVEKPTAPTPSDGRLRSLLARRLVRAGRVADAKRYLSPDLAAAVEAYFDGIRDGRDVKKSNADRAAALMSAARVADHRGMEMMGTELGPDFGFTGGNFELGAGDHNRAKYVLRSADEQKRVDDSKPADGHRYHYHYTAAELAWSASQLMPDDSPQLADCLYEAGCWLKNKDPKSADRFYKSLVKRCPTVPLAQRAAKLHWFPKPASESNKG